MTDLIRAGNLTIDRGRYIVWVDDESVALTYIEFELLATLARNRGRVLSRQQILEAVWGRPNANGCRKLAVHISRLRKKIAASRPWAIRTVKKRGYALTDAGAEPRTATHSRQGLSPDPTSQQDQQKEVSSERVSRRE